MTEAFVDRAYQSNGTLVPRSGDGAVLSDVEVICARAVRMVTEGRVTAIDGTDVAVNAESMCVHGDTPGAVAMAVAVRRALEATGVEIRSFMP